MLGGDEREPVRREQSRRLRRSPSRRRHSCRPRSLHGQHEYSAAYNEVKSLGGNGTTTPTHTATQTVIGIYWGYDGRPGLGTPPRLYNQIVRTIAKQQHNTEAQNARLFGLVNIAMADAGLAAWNTKYHDAMWRPIMGIRGGDTDGNPATTGDKKSGRRSALRPAIPGRVIQTSPRHSRPTRRATRRLARPRFKS